MEISFINGNNEIETHKTNSYLEVLRYKENTSAYLLTNGGGTILGSKNLKRLIAVAEKELKEIGTYD